MAKSENSATSAPRGSRVVSQAFFAALDAVPDIQRAVVARAAQEMIRDELKARRDMAGKAVAKGRRPTPRRAKPAATAKRQTKAATPKPARKTRRVAAGEPAA